MKSKRLDPKAIRRKLGLNQQQFWSRLGVTQSGGSRYESGRAMPAPTETLLVIAHGTPAQAEAMFKKLRAQ